MTFHIDLINVSEIAPFVPSVIIIQILKIIRQGHNRRLDLVAALIQGRQWRGTGGQLPPPPRFWQNRRRSRVAAPRRITTCPPSFRKLLTPLINTYLRKYVIAT